MCVCHCSKWCLQRRPVPGFGVLLAFSSDRRVRASVSVVVACIPILVQLCRLLPRMAVGRNCGDSLWETSGRIDCGDSLWETTGRIDCGNSLWDVFVWLL